MPITTTENREVKSGNDVATEWSFSFVYFDASTIRATRYDSDGVQIDGDGAPTSDPLVITTDYTLTGGSGAAGALTTVSFTLATGESLVIERVEPYTQAVDLLSGATFPSSVIEIAFDKLVMLTQQLKDLVERSIVLPATSLLTGLEIPIPAASKFLRWNAAGTALENADLEEAGTIGIPVAIAKGGTNATTEAGARTALAAAGLADDNSFSGDNVFAAGTKQLFRSALALAEGLLTISSGSVTAARAAHIVAAESGTTDDLTNIVTSGVDDNAILLIRPDAGDTITVKDAATGAGEIHLADNADLALSGDDSLILQRRGADWYEVSRSPQPVAGFPAPDFESSELAVTADTLITAAHSLGAAPTLVQVIARCKTDDLGYDGDADEEVMAANIGEGGGDLGLTIAWDATNVYLVQGVTPIYVHSKSTFNRAAGDPAKWKWVIRVWA